MAAGLATGVGIAIGLTADWFPPQASTQANQIDTLYKVLIVATMPIFVLVVTVILFSVWQFRMRPGQELQDGPPIHGNTRLEIVWTVLPAIMILGLVSYSFVVLHDIEKKPAREIQVNVTGQQFAWSYEYPSSVTGGAPLSTDQLVLPKGESVQFNMVSKDVIHAFWVPAFRVQEDVVPGITTHYRITPTRLGSYDVICNELCGLGHSVMRSTVSVVTPDQFATWLKSKTSTQAAGGGPAGGATATAGGAAAAGGASGIGNIANPGTGANANDAALVAQGRQIFTGPSGCGGCHTLADAHSSGTIGPNLNSVLVGAKHSPGFVATSIVDPNAYVESGFPAGVMPQTFGSTLSKAQLAALVSYLLKVAHQ